LQADGLQGASQQLWQHCIASACQSLPETDAIFSVLVAVYKKKALAQQLVVAWEQMIAKELAGASAKDMSAWQRVDAEHRIATMQARLEGLKAMVAEHQVQLDLE
jgi:hypothetical protein